MLVLQDLVSAAKPSCGQRSCMHVQAEDERLSQQLREDARLSHHDCCLMYPCWCRLTLRAKLLASGC